MNSDVPSAVCVLGCRPGSAALARRARAARDAFIEQKASIVIACGGRAWGGRIEADELARMLSDGGVPPAAIVRERVSVDTYENAAYAARILGERGIRQAIVVTCTWHLPRAMALFERAGVPKVDGVGAPPPAPSIASRIWWTARERVSLWKDLRR